MDTSGLVQSKREARSTSIAFKFNFSLTATFYLLISAGCLTDGFIKLLSLSLSYVDIV